jgi:hypothetical protein
MLSVDGFSLRSILLIAFDVGVASLRFRTSLFKLLRLTLRAVARRIRRRIAQPLRRSRDKQSPHPSASASQPDLSGAGLVARPCKAKEFMRISPLPHSHGGYFRDDRVLPRSGIPPAWLVAHPRRKIAKPTRRTAPIREKD